MSNFICLSNLLVFRLLRRYVTNSIKFCILGFLADDLFHVYELLFQSVRYDHMNGNYGVEQNGISVFFFIV